MRFSDLILLIIRTIVLCKMRISMTVCETLQGLAEWFCHSAGLDLRVFQSWEKGASCVVLLWLSMLLKTSPLSATFFAMKKTAVAPMTSLSRAL
jgi:hypothetical protein